MTKMTISEAFKALSIRATYEGLPAVIVPLTSENIADIDQSKVKQGANAGEMLVAWNEGEKRNGKVLFADARSEVELLIARNDGTDKRIRATSMTDAALDILRQKNKARENQASVASQNVKGLEAHEAAVAKGDATGEYEPVQTKYAEDAFDRFDTFLTCVRESVLAIKADKFSDIAAKAAADSFTAKMRDLTRDTLTLEEKQRATTARELRGQIALLSPNHAKAIAVLPPAYTGDFDAVRNMMHELPEDHQGVTAAQSSAMSRSGNMGLVTRLFSVATTAPVMSIGKAPLSHQGFKTIAQELAKHVDQDATDKILPRMAAVTSDAMEDYGWQGKVYNKDGADILLMKDEYAAFVYVWPEDSRVGDLDVNATVLAGFTREDVPTEDEIEALRAEVDALRHDNGADIDFDFDDEPEDDAADFDA